MDSLKTLWREKQNGIWSFYCPQCKIPRKVPFRPQPSPRHYAQIALTSVVFMLMTWHWFSWKGIVAFVPFWTVFEMIYRTRMRAALACESCGFDPILYLVDAPSARREIEGHWRKRFEEKGIPYPSSPQQASASQPRTAAPVRPGSPGNTPSGIEEELANTRGPRTTQ